MNYHFLIVQIFALLFAINTLRRHQFNWFWFAVAIWLVLGLFSARILPNVLGITHLTNAYLVHFYVFVGSIFFFLNNTFRLPERPATWQAPKAGGYLTLLATSGLSLHLAFAAMLILTWWVYPQGYSAMLPAKLLAMYVFDPFFWFGTQFLLMLLFALHRAIRHDALDVFSAAQIQVGVLLGLLWQSLYVMDAYRWLPRLLRWLWFNIVM